MEEVVAAPSHREANLGGDGRAARVADEAGEVYLRAGEGGCLLHVDVCPLPFPASSAHGRVGEHRSASASEVGAAAGRCGRDKAPEAAIAEVDVDCASLGQRTAAADIAHPSKRRAG